MYQTLLKRIDERSRVVDESWPRHIDFTVDEEMITDPDATTYAQNDDEVRDKWRKRIKYDLLVQKADGKTDAEAKRERSAAAITASPSGCTRSTQRRPAGDVSDGDHRPASIRTPTTCRPARSKNFDIQMRLQLEGIGAALQFDDGYTVVSKFIPGGAGRQGRPARSRRTG